MARMLQLFYWLPVLFMSFFMVEIYLSLNAEIDSFNNEMLQRQVNASSDAAVLEAITNNSDIESDYSHNKIEIDPDVCKREFVTTLLGNLGYSVTEEAIENFENTAIMSLQICMYDGVYTYYQDKYATRNVSQGALHNRYKLVSTPKTPYFYTPEDEVDTAYALTLDLDKAYRLYTVPSEEVDGMYNLKINTVPVPVSHITRDRQLTVINNTVSKWMKYALIKSYGTGDINKSYNIPAHANSITGAQPVRDLNVIGIVDLSDYGAMSDYTVMGIGGNRIVKSDPVVTYIRDGVRYWNYTSKCGDLNLLSDVKAYDSEYTAVLTDKAAFDLKGRE